MILSPKEKAEELVDKMYGKTPVRDLIAQIEEDKQYAKQCALVAVDEILFLLEFNLDFRMERSITYYLEVKQEIINL